MSDELRRRITEGKLTLPSMSIVEEIGEAGYRASNSALPCPHCGSEAVRVTFQQHEKFTCLRCKLESIFVIWSRTKDTRNWVASLSPIN